VLIEVDGKSARVDMTSLNVHCSDQLLYHLLVSVCQKTVHSLTPICSQKGLWTLSYSYHHHHHVYHNILCILCIFKATFLTGTRPENQTPLHHNIRNKQNDAPGSVRFHFWRWGRDGWPPGFHFFGGRGEMLTSGIFLGERCWPPGFFRGEILTSGIFFRGEILTSGCEDNNLHKESTKTNNK